jgi:hypothetical protein
LLLEAIMADRLAVVLEDTRATVAQGLAEVVENCTAMDGEALGEYVERAWCPSVGGVAGLMFLVREMKRRFGLLGRKKQANGEYPTLRGFRSFKKWFASFTGRSERLGYYLLESEEKKNGRNAARRRGRAVTLAVGTVARVGDRKITLTQGMLDALIALLAAEDGDSDPDPRGQAVKRSRRAKTTKRPTQAASAAQPAAAAPTAPLGECEHCGDGTLATEVVNVTEYSKGDKVCAKCAEGTRKADRKWLMRQMSVQKCYGKFFTRDKLVTLGGKTVDFGDGNTLTYPTVADYVERLKRDFGGRSGYDRAVVSEYIAEVERKLAAKV